MKVSNYDHELWYGDHTKAQKMVGDDNKKDFHCKLNNLDLAVGNFASNFNINVYRA